MSDMVIRKARKQHQCSETSYHTIRPGDLYLYADCPPWHEMNSSRKSDSGGRRWMYIRACLRCAEQYGMLTSDNRKTIEAKGKVAS